VDVLCEQRILGILENSASREFVKKFLRGGVRGLEKFPARQKLLR
jgi:hypothetical protein